MGIFIQISLQHDRLAPKLHQHIVALCPVDIFAIEGDHFISRPDQEDECTLCELCLRAAPPGGIIIYKLYSGETLVSTGEATHA
jgi:NAD-dependent dihydropyrimidine dehydrogenase PreA subunit